MQVLLEANGYRRLGTDLFIAFSPEREDPGNATFTTTKIPKIIGGLDQPSLDRATEIYQQVFEKIIPVASTDVAEAAKITENVFAQSTLPWSMNLKWSLMPWILTSIKSLTPRQPNRLAICPFDLGQD